jgi:sulfate permease, SulP family
VENFDLWNNGTVNVQSRWSRIFPIWGYIRHYSAKDYVMDIIAGIVIAVVLVPETIAYASLAGLPPEIGIYTAIVAYLVYSIMGHSRQLVVAPVSIMSLMVGASLGQQHYTPEQYIVAATVLAFLVGLILFILGLFKGGYLENLLSKPVGLGFITAGAAIVATTQLPHLLGIEVHTVSGPLKTIDTWRQLAFNLDQTDWLPLLIGVAGVASIQLSKKISPLMPGALINVLIGVAILYFMGGGLNSGRVALVGPIPGHFPTFSVPWAMEGQTFWNALQSIHIDTLILLAPGIALVNIIESLSIAKVMAGRNGDKVDANRELMSIGMANMASSFFHSYLAAGSLSKTSVSYQAGSKSQLSGVFAVIAVILTLLFLTPYLYYVPVACLGAIIMVAAYHLFEYKTIKRTFRIRKTEGWLIVATFVLTLALGVDYGILAGIVISFGLVIWKTARPRIYPLGLPPGSLSAYQEVGVQELQTSEDELIVKIDGPLYFANASYVEVTLINMLAENHKLRRFIIDARALSDIDLSGESVLWELLKILIWRDCHLAIVGANKAVLDFTIASGFHEFLGPMNFYASIHEAVKGLKQAG